MPCKPSAAVSTVAVYCGDRVEAGRIGSEIAGPHQAVAVAAVQEHPRQRRAVALVDQLRDSAAGRQVDVLRQGNGRWPDLRRIDPAAGPIDRNLPLGQPGKLLGQEQRPPRTGLRRVEDIAGEDQQFGLLGQDGIEHPAGRGVRGLQQRFPQVVGHLGHALNGRFQVEIAGMDESEGPVRHVASVRRCRGKGASTEQFIFPAGKVLRQKEGPGARGLEKPADCVGGAAVGIRSVICVAWVIYIRHLPGIPPAFLAMPNPSA